MANRVSATWQSNVAPSSPEIWSLALNRYQRDNLLHLLNSIGYPRGNEYTDEHIGRFNTGDWVGEIALRLAKGPNNVIVIDEDDRPNPIFRSREES